jgi:hypothetical protein
MAGMEPDDRAFMRELLQRHEKASDAMPTGFDAMIKRFDAGTEQLQEHTREMREEHREFLEEARAQRAAVFRILDRLDEGGAGAGA